MKFNKLMVVCIFLLAIVTIGAASAADENVTDTADDVLSIDDGNDDLFAESLDDEVIAESTGTFSDLKTLVDNTASGNTLYLEKDYSTDKSGSTVKISNSITIDGKGHTLNANKKSSIFLVDNNNVVLKNIKFINSYGNSGAIFSNYKNCSIINCSFDNCNAYGDGGGAIYQGNAYNCSFVKCSSSADGAAGGAISYGNAYDCSFESCYCIDECNGGAIGYGNAYNCSFVKCTSWLYGGAISYGNAYNSSFVDCSADEFGGSIYQGNAYGCSFVNCHAMSGGAISRGNAYGCSFIKCHDEHERGGAIYYGNAYNCSFIDCTADEAGAIYKGDAYDCSFVGCSAIQGGAIDYGSAVDCLFINCSAQDGGATAYCSAYDCLFINCSAKEHGAVVYWGNASNSFCVNCHDAYDELSCPNAWSEDNYNEGNYALKSDSPFIYGYVAANSIDSSKVIVVAKMVSDATGNVKFTINGVTKKVKVANGKAQTYFYDLVAGTYPVNIQYDGNNVYPADSISTSIEIKQQNAIISVSAADVGYGKDAVIKVNLNKNVQGNLDVVLNGITKNVKITGETVNVRFSGLAMGNYNVTVSYPGSDKFPAQNMTSSINVVKGTPIASGEVNPNPVGFGDDAIIKVNMLNSIINGNVWFTISDENKTKILTDKIHIEYGIATQAIPGLGLGKYYLHLYYAGNSHYNAQTVKGSFEVVKKTPIASVNVSNWAIDSDPTIKVKVNNVNGNIWFTVSDENKTQILTDKIHIEDGWAIVSVPNLKVGKYYLHIYYAGNVHYSAQTIKSSFEVTKISPELSVAKTTVDGKTVLTASVPEDARGNVKFEVNGTVYKAPIVKGVANLTLPDLAPGTYRLTSSYAGNYKYLAETKIRSITIK